MLKTRYNRKSGTSLVEILVVIVIFLVGILGVAQIFPRGLGILKTTKNNSIAQNLARSEVERLKGQAEQLAEGIFPVDYAAGAGGFVSRIDLNRRPNDFLPRGATIDAAGNMSASDGTPLGNWKRFCGPNVIRRVIGEGRKIPSPRFIPLGGGTQEFGSIMTLQFGPVIFGSNTQTFAVYGNDFSRVFGTPRRLPQPTTNVYFYDDETDQIYLPQGQRNREYRITFNYVVNIGGNFESRTGIFGPIPVAGQANPSFVQAGLGALTSDPDFVRVEDDTLRVQRYFEPVAFATPFDTAPVDDAVYQYKVLDRAIGTLMFNPAGFGYQERVRRGRIPLKARVDYDVFDWRIIRDDFRVPTQLAPHRLAIQGLKVKGGQDVDGTRYDGVGFLVRNDTQQRDFILIDLETGGILTEDSYQIDKSLGMVTVLPNAQVVYTGSATPEALDMSGRSVRALYMGRGEIAVQATKAASEYVPTSSVTLGLKQCYLGDTNATQDGDPDKIYFPLSDIGKKVTVGELWYRDSANILRQVFDQEFMIEAPRATDIQLGVVDLRKVFTDLDLMDYSNGYSVRRVRGASVDVIVTWSSASFQIGTTSAENLSRLDGWLSTTRRSQAESFLVRGVDQ